MSDHHLLPRYRPEQSKSTRKAPPLIGPRTADDDRKRLRGIPVQVLHDNPVMPLDRIVRSR